MGDEICDHGEDTDICVDCSEIDEDEWDCEDLSTSDD